MLGSYPCNSVSCALSAPLMQAAFSPTTPLQPSASARPSTWIGQDGVRSRLRVIEPAPTAQHLETAGRLNSRSSPDTDQQLKLLIADAMRQLPFEHRAVIYRAHYQGWTTGRIADDLNITEAAVKSRLHDGLRTLGLTFHRMGRRR
jgi:DNA-directed RNA polymerase specialized sigma24 family protein